MHPFLSFLSSIPVLVFILASVIGGIAGDYFAKLWSLDQRGVYFFVAIFGYLCASFFYIPALLQKGLVVTSVLSSLFGAIGFLVVGLLVFHEPLTSLQLIGVMLGFVALIILSLP